MTWEIAGSIHCHPDPFAAFICGKPICVEAALAFAVFDRTVYGI